jgi:hypothetical protein
MAADVDTLELGEAGVGDHLQSLARGIRQEVEMEQAQSWNRLWISMWESLA